MGHIATSLITSKMPLFITVYYTHAGQNSQLPEDDYDEENYDD